MEANINIADYELIKNFNSLYEKKVILYGAGFWGRNVYVAAQRMGISVYKVIQTKPDVSKFVNDLPVDCIEDVATEINQDDCLIILASFEHYEAMLSMLSKLEVYMPKICTVYAFILALSLHRKDNAIPQGYKQELEQQLRLSREHHECVRSAVHYHWIQQMRAYQDVLVYQPGKVGSTSVATSLSRVVPTLQMHTLSNLNVPMEIQKNFQAEICDSNRSWKIVSMVRNPIARDISNFLQNTDTESFWPWLPNLPLSENLDRCAYDLCTLCSKYLLHIIQNEEDEFSWFDKEMNSFWGIDVYKYPFDLKLGYTIIRQGKMELLLMKSEKLFSLEAVIRDFINNVNFKMSSENVGDKKIYKYLYSYIKKNIVLPREYVNYYFSNPKVRHFYSKTELDDAVERFQVETTE